MTAATYTNKGKPWTWEDTKRGLRRTPPPLYALVAFLMAAGLFCLYMSWVTY